MKTLKSIFTIFLYFTFTQLYGQIESRSVIQAVIDYDKNINEQNIIVCEYLDDFNDSTWTIYLTNNYGGFQIEKLTNLNFEDLNVRLISKNALLELQRIANRLNDCKSPQDESFDLLYHELVYDLFGRNLCFFNKVLFSENKLVAIVRYRVVTGNALGLGNHSTTYLVKKENGKWYVQEVLEFEI